MALGCAVIPESSTSRQTHKATRHESHNGPTTLHCLPIPSLSPHCCPERAHPTPAQLCYAAQAGGRATGATPAGASGSGAQSGFARTVTAALRRNASTRSRKKLMLAVASRPPRPYIWYVGAPGGVTPLEARENFSGLAELLSTNVVRRSRPRSANYSTIWLRLHLRLRLRLRTRPASQCRAASLS